MKNTLTHGFDAKVIESLIKRMEKDEHYNRSNEVLLVTIKELEYCFSRCENLTYSKGSLFFYLLSNLTRYKHLTAPNIQVLIQDLLKVVQETKHRKPLAIRVNQLIEQLIVIDPNIVPGHILDSFYREREKDLRN